MSHERSETIQTDAGEWVNVYGRGTRQEGEPLPGEPHYHTREEAEAGARQRSESFPSFQEGAFGVTVSDTLRGRDYAVAESSPQPPPSSGLGSIADRISATEADLIAARKKEREGLEAKSAALAPRLSQATSALDTRAQQLAQNPPPAPPVLQPPPSRNLSAFLSPRQGESPEASVQKLIQAIGLFAGGVGGLARGDARGSLAAFTGALKGWNEGDIERGDRAFKDWEAKTSTALKAWETERTAYRDWYEAGNLQVDQMRKGLQLTAMQSDNKQAVLAFESGNLEKGLAFLTKQQEHAEKLEETRARLLEAHESRMGREAHQREMEKIAREKIDEGRRQANALAESITPDALDNLAWKYLMGEPLPAFVRSKGGPLLVLKISERATQLGRERGINPSDTPAIKADLDAAKKALIKLRGSDVITEAQAKRFDTHMDGLVQLSEAKDNTGRPVFERWKLKVQGKYEGDGPVARIEVQALEVAMEYAKLTTPGAQGDAATRDEARKIINAWMSKPQMREVGEQLKQNAHNNVANNRAKEQELIHYIDTLGGRIEKPGTEPKPAKVEMPNDSKAGRKTAVDAKGERWELPANTDLAKYPGWKWE